METNGAASAKFPGRGLGLVTDRLRFGGGVTAMFTVIPFHHPLSPNSQKDLDPWADRRIPHPGIPVT